MAGGPSVALSQPALSLPSVSSRASEGLGLSEATVERGQESKVYGKVKTEGHPCFTAQYLW